MRGTTIEGVRIGWTRADPDRRRDAGRALIRTLAAEIMPDLATAMPWDIVQRCAICGGPHGRPLLPGTPLLASVAYADPWVIAAVAHHDDADAIGIDLEVEGAAPELAALFAPQDPPDLRGWTAIEAALKADGRGVMVPPDQVLIDAAGSCATVPGGPELRLFPIHADPGMIATLALSRG